MLGLVSRATGVRAMAVSDVAPAASAATGTLAPRVAMVLTLTTTEAIEKDGSEGCICRWHWC
jgi:hypothetical protein